MNKEGRIIITRTLMQFDVKTKNGNVYTRKNVINMDDIHKYIAERRMFGEVFIHGVPDHREGDPSTSLKNVSHIFNKVWEENNKLIGEIEILKTYMGKHLADNIDKFVFRPRSYANFQEDGTMENVRILSFDAIPKSNDSWDSTIDDSIS